MSETSNNKGLRVQFTGRWLLGSTGSDRVSELRAHLDTKDIAKAFSAGASQRPYAPWMSSKRLIAEQESLPYPIQNHIFCHVPHVVDNEDELNALSAYVTRASFTGLHLIGNQDCANLRIEVANNPWLEKTKLFARSAIQQIMSLSEAWRQRVSTLCQIVVPLGLSPSLPERRDVGRGLSSHLFRGAIFLDPPSTTDHPYETYAINMAHELGHQALFVYQSADAVIDGPLETPVYSVIRKTDRPAIQSYHAVVAAAYMAEFIGDWLLAEREHARNAYLKTRLIENIEHVEQGIQALSVLKYTEVGQQILDEILELASYLRGVHSV